MLRLRLLSRPDLSIGLLLPWARTAPGPSFFLALPLRGPIHCPVPASRQPSRLYLWQVSQTLPSSPSAPFLGLSTTPCITHTEELASKPLISSRYFLSKTFHAFPRPTNWIPNTWVAVRALCDLAGSHLPSLTFNNASNHLAPGASAHPSSLFPVSEQDAGRGLSWTCLVTIFSLTMTPHLLRPREAWVDLPPLKVMNFNAPKGTLTF